MVPAMSDEIARARTAFASAFPLDGPHTAEQIVAAADVIGELTRYLNYATRARGVLDPADLAAVLLALNDADGKRDQLYRQLSNLSVAFGELPGLYDDRGGDPRQVLARISQELLNARSSAESHRVAVGRAAGAASQLGADPE
jgi:hypothetical protein